jgi:membrane-bound serine protease (ClpP class)
MKRIGFYALCLCLISFWSAASAQTTYSVKRAHFLQINSSINPATFNYLDTHLKKFDQKYGDLVVIKMDTPGGLVTTTKDIITLIGSLTYPVVMWITPEGASATSAGAIISSSAHLLYMSEGTNIGAATPVSIGKDIEQQDGKQKAINDLVALVSSLSKSRGRNDKLFAKMITDAASFDAQTALKENLINGIVNTRVDLLKTIDQQVVKVLGKEMNLSIEPGLETTEITMDPGQQILNIFSNPSTAYILFIIGAALLYLEFQAPGGFVAGAIGAVSLVLAGIGFQVLPLNFGAMGLIILSFVLFILEAYITSYGILTLGGIASLVFGSLFLFRTENAYLDIQMPLVLSVVFAIVIYVILIGFVIFKTHKKQPKFFTRTDQTGHVTKFLKEEDGQFYYQVKVNGEIWNAIATMEMELNEKVFVTQEDNEHMTLKIEKA